jgi:protein disulfide-isomerase
VGATTWPYDEKADAAEEVQHALGAAHGDHKKVLLVFGANWCEDCRALDRALHGRRMLIEGPFDVVKIDKNLELDARYGRSRTASRRSWSWTPTTS